MTIRLNKVTRDLNVGITTAVEFLQKKGFTVEANPNTKITDEQFDLLKKEFSTDKDLKIKSERFSQERQSKDRNKASVSIDGYEKETQEKAKPEEIKTVIPEDARPKFKPVGKIDLDKLNRRPAPVQEKEKEVVEKKVAVEEKKVEEPAPVVVETPKPEPAPVLQPEPQPEPKMEPQPQPEPQPEPVAKEEPAPVVEAKEEPKKEEMKEVPASAPVAEEAPAEKEEKKEKKGEEIFKIHQPEFVSKINVIGQIDLAALNQSTRPKKKSKEEKRKEREEKEKIRLDQKKQMKEAIIKEIRRDDSKQKDAKDNGTGDPNKKKRVRINKEKVDINNASNFQRGGNDRTRNNNGGPGGNQQGGNQQGGNNKNRNKDRFKKPVIKQEVNEEDVAKQVKETLARLTSKGKNKGAKYPKPGGIQSGDNPKYGSTLGYFDSSYWKVRNITLGYNFEKQAWLTRMGVQSLRAYLSVQNPFIICSPFHKETGLDPETNSYGNENVAVTEGIQKRFLTVGTNSPSTRNYLFGINLTF